MPGIVLYSLVFIYAHRYWLVGNVPLGGQPELLLFLLPGAVMALLHAESPLKSTLLMALWGTLLASCCCIIRCWPTPAGLPCWSGA